MLLATAFKIFNNVGDRGLNFFSDVVSEYMERISAYIERMERYTKLRISQYIMVQHEKCFVILSFNKRCVGLSKKTNNATVPSN